MTLERALELMQIEQRCVERNNICDHNCAACDLVQTDTELIAAYKVAQQCIMSTIINNNQSIV